MSTDYKFPTDTCVLACSGPSLNLVDVFELGLPVVAISTAIRTIPNPHYWILADFLNEMHGNEGSVAYQNENIVKVVPDGKIHAKHKNYSKNFITAPYSDNNSIQNKEQHLFSGKMPIIKGPHKSVTFAVQWLHAVGVKNIIWTGNDLVATSVQTKYAYEVNSYDMRKANNFKSTLDQVSRTLKEWYPIARKKDLQWYSWKCGSEFEKIVPVFDYESYQKSITKFSKPAKHSSNPPQNIVVSSPKKAKAEKKQKRIQKNNGNVVQPVRKNTPIPKPLNEKENHLNKIELKNKNLIIKNEPKTKVVNKKQLKYVKVNSKNIKDSLR